MDDTYLTISRTSEGIYKEKMSKFLAFAIPVSSVEDVKKQLEKYQGVLRCSSCLLGIYARAPTNRFSLER